jgi:hypothetical protein
MDKKTAREAYGGGWQSRYFQIRVDGYLYYYKKADTTAAPLGSLDLSKVADVSLHSNKDGSVDLTRINIETPEGTMKLRCRSEESAAEWR